MAQALNDKADDAPTMNFNMSIKYYKQRTMKERRAQTRREFSEFPAVPPEYRAGTPGAHLAPNCILTIDAGTGSKEEIKKKDYSELSLLLDNPSAEVSGALEFIIPLCPNLKSLSLVLTTNHHLNLQHQLNIGQNIGKALEVLKRNEIRLEVLGVTGDVLRDYRWMQPIEEYVQWAETKTLKLNLVDCAAVDWEGAHFLANALSDGRLPFSNFHLYSKDACVENHFLDACLSVEGQQRFIKEVRLVSIAEQLENHIEPSSIKDHYQMLHVKELMTHGQLLQNCTVFGIIGRGLNMQGLIQLCEICEMVMKNGLRLNCPAFLLESRTRTLRPDWSRPPAIDDMMMNAIRRHSQMTFQPFSLCMGATSLETKIVSTLNHPVAIVSWLAREMADFMPTISADIFVATNDKRNGLTKELAEVVEINILHQYTNAYLIWPNITRRKENPNEYSSEFRHATHMRRSPSLCATGKCVASDVKRPPIDIDGGHRAKRAMTHSITWMGENKMKF